MNLFQFVQRAITLVLQNVNKKNTEHLKTFLNLNIIPLQNHIQNIILDLSQNNMIIGKL